MTPPNLRVSTFDDYEQISKLENRHQLESQPKQDWISVWTGNPIWKRLSDQWPMGWVLEDSTGHIVGSLMNVPSLYQFQGRDLISANGRGWVVEEKYRGVALWLMDEYFNQDKADLFINTTVGPMAEQTFSQLSARIPLGDWQNIAYFITGYRGFARFALEKTKVPMKNVLAFPAGAALYFKDKLTRKSLPKSSVQYAIRETTPFDSHFDAFWKQLVSENPNKLLAARDSESLAWHYAIPQRRGNLKILTAWREGLLRGYVVLKRQDQPGGIKNRVRLVDFQALEHSDDLLATLLRASLETCIGDGMYLLEHLGCELPKMRLFDESTPYRKHLACWPFYFHASDAQLNKQLSDPKAWDASAFDGDASFE